MKKMIVLAASVALAIGVVACKKDKKKDSEGTEGKATKDTPKEKPEEKPAAVVDTPEKRITRYNECLGFYNAGDMDKLAGCYTDSATTEFVDSGMPAPKGGAAIAEAYKVWRTAMPDVKVTPIMYLSNGTDLAVLYHSGGTHSGPLASPMGEIPATGKKVGSHGVHLIQFDGDTGQVANAWHFNDMSTLLGQLGLNPAPHRAAADAPTGEAITAIASEDGAAEKANVDMYNASMEQMNKKDLKAMSATWADDYKATNYAAPADEDAKTSLAGLKSLLGAFPDLKLKPTTVFGAGNYTVAVATMTGTNSGAWKDAGIPKGTGKAINVTAIEITEFADGKVKSNRMMFNSMALAMQLGLVEGPGADEGDDDEEDDDEGDDDEEDDDEGDDDEEDDDDDGEE